MTKAMFTFLRSTAERWPDERSASNQLIIILLYQNLKDEGQFRKTLGRETFLPSAPVYVPLGIPGRHTLSSKIRVNRIRMNYPLIMERASPHKLT